MANYQVRQKTGRLAQLKILQIGAEGLGFDSRAGHVGHSVANGLQPLRYLFGAEQSSAKPGRWGAPLVTRFGIIPRV